MTNLTEERGVMPRQLGQAIVAETEALYERLFLVAALFAVGTTCWGLVIAPFNSFDHHLPRSLVLGGALLALVTANLTKRMAIYRLFRRHPTTLLALVGAELAVLWADGGWRSSYYVASYAPVCFAAVVVERRHAVAIGLMLGLGYLSGLVINGYTWERLVALHDADSVVANASGYVLAGWFLATPVRWLARYVATTNQRLSTGIMTPIGPGLLTPGLSDRELEVALLLGEGYSNLQIAHELSIKLPTVKSHVRNIIRKLGVQNRGGVMSIVLHERLLNDTHSDAQNSQHSTID